jgi:hypothetical protein
VFAASGCKIESCIGLTQKGPIIASRIERCSCQESRTQSRYPVSPEPHCCRVTRARRRQTRHRRGAETGSGQSVTESTELTDWADSSVLSILSRASLVRATGSRPPAGGPGHAPGAETASSTRTRLHERRGRRNRSLRSPGPTVYAGLTPALARRVDSEARHQPRGPLPSRVAGLLLPAKRSFRPSWGYAGHGGQSRGGAMRARLRQWVRRPQSCAARRLRWDRRM